MNTYFRVLVVRLLIRANKAAYNCIQFLVDIADAQDPEQSIRHVVQANCAQIMVRFKSKITMLTFL